MTAAVEKMSAAAFRAFRRAIPIVRVDDGAGIAWLGERCGKVCCTDRVSLWNNSAGGVDDVLVVLADSETEAALRLERVRSR